MTRYNHFAQKKYKDIFFSSLKVGEKFRNHLSRGKAGTARYIVCIKTDVLQYQEVGSKKIHNIHSSNLIVSHYSHPYTP